MEHAVLISSKFPLVINAVSLNTAAGALFGSLKKLSRAADVVCTKAILYNARVNVDRDLV